MTSPFTKVLFINKCICTYIHTCLQIYRVCTSLMRKQTVAEKWYFCSYWISTFKFVSIFKFVLHAIKRKEERWYFGSLLSQHILVGWPCPDLLGPCKGASIFPPLGLNKSHFTLCWEIKQAHSSKSYFVFGNLISWSICLDRTLNARLLKWNKWPIPESCEYHFYFWSKCFTRCCWLVAVWFHQWKADCWQSQRQQTRFAHNPTFLFFLKSIFFLQKCIFLKVCILKSVFFSNVKSVLFKGVSIFLKLTDGSKQYVFSFLAFNCPITWLSCFQKKIQLYFFLPSNNFELYFFVMLVHSYLNKYWFFQYATISCLRIGLTSAKGGINLEQVHSLTWFATFTFG